MFGIAATSGRYERRTARRLSIWTREYLREVAVAVFGVFMAAQIRFGSDVTGICIALGLALPVLRLVNAFPGDMSLVGPQPALAAEAAEHAGHLRRRLAVKPGLIGLWSASGRSVLSQKESVLLDDLRYVENWLFRRTTCSALVHRSDAC